MALVRPLHRRLFVHIFHMVIGMLIGKAGSSDGQVPLMLLLIIRQY